MARVPGVFRGRRLLAVGVVLIGLVVLPRFLTRDLVTALFFAFALITVALNYDLLGGFLGYLNLGQGTFFGGGAYAVFILTKHMPGVAAAGPLALIGLVVVAVAIIALFAAIVAYPLFRLKGAYFAMATFGLFLLVRQLILNLERLTGGAFGIYLPPGYYVDQRLAYWLMLGVVTLSVAVNYLISQTRLGVGLHAIRESEPAAAAIGIDLFRHKQTALVISVIPSALAGCLFGLHFGYVDLESVLGVDKTLLPVIMAMLGGTGLVLGPIVGGVLIRVIDVSLKNYLTLPIPALGVYGLILMVIGLFMPEGILAGLTRRRRVAPRA
ncbi:MAG: branched-chain amino acid ABC transporter permease [Armatimonadetes bacterium]|nr:branched-chain amino acid ABC transporter permease [Armatimonadota bacterium]